MELKLMNKNSPVGVLTGNLKMRNGFPAFDVTDIKITDTKLCPVILSNTKANKSNLISLAQHWIDRRIIPACRQEQYKTILEDTSNKFLGSDKYHFFTLNDQYWLKYSEDESWEALNFFTNNFYDNKTENSISLMGDIFFSENLNNIEHFEGDYHSPDITIEGNMLKRWIKNDNRICLYKTGSTEQIMNEVLATSILKELRNMGFLSQNFRFVNYNLGIINNKLCSCSSNFVTPSSELVTAYEIYSSTPTFPEEKECPAIERPFIHLICAVKYYKIPNAESFIKEMNIADKYLNFYDRHLRNFGFMRNVSTGEFTGPAPLYDFGEIFVSEEKKDAEHDLFKHARNKIKISLDKNQLETLRNTIKNHELVSEKLKSEAEKQLKKLVEARQKSLTNEDL